MKPGINNNRMQVDMELFQNPWSMLRSPRRIRLISRWKSLQIFWSTKSTTQDTFKISEWEYACQIIKNSFQRRWHTFLLTVNLPSKSLKSWRRIAISVFWKTLLSQVKFTNRNLIQTRELCACSWDLIAKSKVCWKKLCWVVFICLRFR